MTAKDKTINNILVKLKKALPFACVELVDYWDADLCAVGFKKDDKLVYLSTYVFVKEGKKGTVKYDYDFELLNEQDKTEVNVIKEAREIDEATLIKDIKEFLEL